MDHELSRAYPSGFVLFNEGDPADTAYIIDRGTVAITTGQGEDAHLLSELGPGEILGEMALIDDQPRTATATCVSECHLKVIHRDVLVQRIEAADPIIRHLLELTLQRYRQGLHADDAGPASPVRPVADVTEAMDKLNLEVDLRQALQDGQLQCVYQPIQDLALGRIAGFEALTRWEHPQLGAINPEAFITLAEETDLIVPIGLHNMRQACRDLKAFQARTDLNLFMSINISGRQLHSPDFAREVQQIVCEEGLDPRQIKLEITESLVVDFERVQHWIAESKALGFRISLDDFGTGYSGMSLLCQLDLNTLKIDKSFVQAMFDSRCEAVVLETMIHLGLGLQLDIIAEGVESEAHEARLRELGVQYGQGYHYARPSPAEEILRLLQ